MFYHNLLLLNKFYFFNAEINDWISIESNKKPKDSFLFLSFSHSKRKRRKDKNEGKRKIKYGEKWREI